jgi:hypothetical protein
MLLSAGVLLAQQPSDQQSMGQQSMGGQMQKGQPSTNQAQPVEVSIPFGMVNGKLVTSGDDLIFIDDQQAENSFVVRRSDIQNAKYEGSTVKLKLSKPVRDSSGERSDLNFRFQNPAAASMITSWLGAGASSGASAQAAAQPTGSDKKPSSSQSRQNEDQSQVATVTTSAPGTEVFDVKRDRRFWRSDTGRLFITPSEVIFQSLSNPGASRRWSMAAIREVTRRNPFELRVQPHSGNAFNFKILSGNGLATSDYVALVDNVNKARLRNNQMIQTDGAGYR